MHFYLLHGVPSLFSPFSASSALCRSSNKKIQRAKRMNVEKGKPGEMCISYLLSDIHSTWNRSSNVWLFFFFFLSCGVYIPIWFLEMEEEEEKKTTSHSILFSFSSSSSVNKRAMCAELHEHTISMHVRTQKDNDAKNQICVSDTEIVVLCRPNMYVKCMYGKASIVHLFGF